MRARRASAITVGCIAVEALAYFSGWLIGQGLHTVNQFVIRHRRPR